MFDSAIAADPDRNPNVYDSKGEIACWIGDTTMAIEYFKKALEVEPQFGTRWSLADLYALIGDYPEAESLYVALAAQESIAWLRTRAREKKAVLELLKGDLPSALNALDNAIAADQFDRPQRSDQTLSLYLDHADRKKYYKALIYERRGMYDSALALANNNSSKHRFLFIRLLLAQGRRAAADSVAQAFYDLAHNSIVWIWQPLHYLNQSYLSLAANDTTRALDYLELMRQSSDKYTRFWPWYLRGVLLYRMDSLSAARVFLDSAADYFFLSRIEMPFANAEVYYYLGDINERLGDTARARREFNHFLAVWPEPDSSFTQCFDARERLARLE